MIRKINKIVRENILEYNFFLLFSFFSIIQLASNLENPPL